MSPEYYRGYPARFERGQREAVRWSLGCMGPFLLLAILGAGCSLYAWHSAGRGPLWWSTIGLLIFVAYFVYLLITGLFPAWQTTIVPYFESSPGHINTFGRGKYLARNCQNLDRIAIEQGFDPMSAFGFYDDLFGETVVWHDSHRGLATFSAIRSVLEQNPGKIPFQAQTLEEIALVEESLHLAAQKQIRFSLLLRMCDVTNAQEWEIRQGTCF
jgi:hypothetical protein